MTQPTPPAPPPDASSPQDNAWSHLLSLETQVQLIQAFFTSHTAELTGLCQTTKAVFLSLQALLEHLPVTLPPTPGDPAAARRFSSTPSLEASALCSKLPHPVLPDVFDGDHFLQSCITYIQSSIEQAGYPDSLQLCLNFYDGLHPSLMDHIDSMAEGHPDDEHVDTWYKVAHEQWQLIELQCELWWTQPLTFPFPHHGFTPQVPPSMPALAAPQAGVALPIPSHVAPLSSLPQGVPMDVDASQQQSSTLLLCQCCGKAGHFPCYCPQELEVCYLTASEQEELLIQLLAAQDATRTPYPDTPIAVSSKEVANVLEDVPAELEDDF
ncbi:hypothetical protein C0989_009617 [Termitomyces sp. Mn162]|nr:hypothetical protein C0989_009617 [Termitomyces sp. Mn162]